MKNKNNHNQYWYDKIRRMFLLSFFDDKSGYAEKEVNGFFLIKQFNDRLRDWEVAIYTKESYQKRKAHKERITFCLVGINRSEDK